VSLNKYICEHACSLDSEYYYDNINVETQNTKTILAANKNNTKLQIEHGICHLYQHFILN